MAISFYREDASYLPRRRKELRTWIAASIEAQHKEIGEISFIYTSNKHLRRINREYLNHNYFTDVITFDYSQEDRVAGDIFISVDQVRLNAQDYGVSFIMELRRVMIHGVLHLLGWKDGNDEERAAMRGAEDRALDLWLRKSE